MGDAADMATEQGMDALALHERGECDSLDPCQLCEPEETLPIAENYRDMRDALRRSMIALDDWLNTYAPEFCDGDRVDEAQKRILDGGGTLAYIADLQEQNREALGEDV